MNVALSVGSSGEVDIKTEADVVAARRTVRDVAAELGFGHTEVTRIVTAASELARNIFKYAGGGVMRWSYIENHNRCGLELAFADKGPGIPEVELAMEPGYSTGGGLGMGLPGVKRLVDEFEIQTKMGQGTTVTLRRWRRT